MTFAFMKRPVRALFIASLYIVLQAGHAIAAEPDQAQAVTVTGELELLYLDDFENKRFELQYFIKDKQSNTRDQLEFEGTPPGHLRTGMPVTAKGKAVGRQLFLAADGVSESSSPSPAQTLPAITGDQRTLVMVGNFKDAAVSCSVD
ncbi:MAG: hypothetical protein P8Z78_15530, partial [Gammaproteobacteria bacterium]